MSLPKVSIVILNWNGWEDTIECLESVYQINYPKFDVIVVDNNSDDESLERIKEYANGKLKLKSNFFEYNATNKPLKVFEYTKEESELLNEKVIYSPLTKIFIIKNDFNYGYAKGNNIGVNFALKNLNPAYILLLNNDMVVDKNFLIELIKFAETDANIGIIGPKVYYYDYPDKIQVTSININFWRGTSYLVGDGETDRGQYDLVKDTDVVSGSCFLFKSVLIKEIGLLNPKYRCYWEESDYCMFAKKVGFRCIYYPHSKVWHKVSKSTNKVSGLLIYYMTRNMFWFMKKHANVIHYMVFIIFFFGLKFWYINIDFLYKKQHKNSLYFLNGVKDGLI